MSLETKEFAEKFTGELDKVLVQQSAVGFMTDNGLKAKFVGAKSVKIPQIDMEGLGDYDRDKGFIDGTINVSNSVFTMRQDRARSFTIDREDMDESGVAQLAGQVMSEFIRTKVVPETDAYVLSKLGGLSMSRSQTINDADLTKPFECFNRLLTEVQSAAGFDEPVVCFVNPYIWRAFRMSDEFSKYITLGSFEQGKVNLQVHMIDNVPIIPVSSSRMQSAYDFLSGKDGENAGGFKAADGAKGIYMLMLPKNAASLVRKSETVRVFAPNQNIEADAYKFDYRLYYDVFVKTSCLSSVWSITAPSVSITANLDSDLAVSAGNISGKLTVSAVSDGGTIEYQWFECDGRSRLNAKKISGETSDSMKLDTSLESGKYYYFVRIVCGGATAADSNVCCVTVS